MERLYLSILLSLVIAAGLEAQQGESIASYTDINSKINSNRIFKTEASYIGDIATNMLGGYKRGSAYLGMANIKIGFETKDAGLWEGGEFFLNGASTHGNTPSSELFGDFQVASNIEAGNHTYLHELWYKHTFERIEFIVGLQDLNSNFITNEYSSSFINSSFGIPSLISNNIPVPIFPLTAFGIYFKYNISESMAIQCAVFDGMPEDFNVNEYNLNWKLKNNDGALIFSELQFTTTIFNLKGTYKAGSYYHTRLKSYNEEIRAIETIFDNNYGFYLLGNQTISVRGNSELGLFAQIAFSPDYINMHNYYLGGGITYSGILSDDGEDLFGAAFAIAGFSYPAGNETTIELFYKSQLTENVFIQPDIQYIINPLGAAAKLDNALGVLIRFGINF